MEPSDEIGLNQANGAAVPMLKGVSAGPAASLHQFARLLRDNGFTISQSDIVDAIRFLATQTDLSAEALRRTLRALFCTRRSDLERFEEIFDAYWFGRTGRRRTIERQGISSREQRAVEHDARLTGGAQGLLDYLEWASKQDRSEEPPDETADDDSGSATRLGGASGRTSALAKDFGKLTDPEEREQLLAFAERLGARLRYRISRRRHTRAKGRSLHLRRSMRQSIPTGGLPLRLVHKIRKQPPVSIVLFIDVSGSMDAYSLFFTRFVHALTGRLARAESFIFHTRLVHISRTLQEADPAKMMEKIALISQGWSGGTRIGEAIASFNNGYARQFAGSRTVALIMSDGFDTGTPDTLANELRRLRARCHKVIWLNPLLGRATYEPKASAMAAALPHLDAFAPAHNLRSLLKLEDLLVRA